jgi:hypothetical protein
VVTGIAVLVAVLLVSATATVLSDDYYAQSLEDAEAYDRFYTEILADPEFNKVTENLTAQLPVDKSVLTANLRIVIPPATLRALVASTILSATQYLEADRDDIDLSVAVEPLVENVKALATTYLTDTVANTPSFQAADLNQFGSAVRQMFDDLEAGKKPTILPSVPITGATAKTVAGIIVSNLPPEQQAEERPVVEALVAQGDLNGALAHGGLTHIEVGDVRESRQLLKLEIGDDGEVDFTASVDAIDDSDTVGLIHQVRWILGDVLPLVLLGSLLLAGAGLFLVGWTTARIGGRPARWIGWTLVAVGVASALLWIVARAIAPDPLAGVLSKGNRGMAPSVRSVLADSWGHAQDRLDQTVAGVAARVVMVGALVLVGAWLIPKLVRWWRTDRRRFWIVTVGGSVALVAFFTLNITIVIGAGADVRQCNGHAELCDRPLDEVVFAGSHNAMASADRSFLSAMQDLTMTDQLEAGVRALLIDAHHWERPEDTNGFLDSLPPETAEGLRPLLEGANPVRPGAWWCHALCRMGAQPLDDGFREIAGFVKQHPDEVLVIVIEDYVTRSEIDESVRRAGLAPFVYTPDDDPDADWPTLGEMVDDGRRVVIFAEKDHGRRKPAWYRNFYDYGYGMETPYDHKGPTQREMTCAPNRGGEHKRLFLMNHWITRGTGSRADAGIVNEHDFIVERARRCAKERDHMVNIVAVDFTTIGDLFEAVDTLNDVEPTTTTTHPRF